MNLCVGLFGTCGGSTWRDKFIETYSAKRIEYFNPQKDNWVPADSAIEAEHLASDAVILFPVLSETYGLGSLAEVGLSILNAIRLDSRRDFVVLIDPDVDEALKEDKVLAKESRKARALVMSHLSHLNIDNLYIVENMDQMLAVSIKLYESNALRVEAQDLLAPGLIRK